MQSSVAPSTLASLPMIGSDNDDCPLTSSGTFPTINSTAPLRSSSVTNTQPNMKASVIENDEGALSDSTSSSSSSDSSEDSDSDTEDVPASTELNGML